MTKRRQPNWQKAKVVRESPNHPESKTVGLEVWLRACAPESLRVENSPSDPDGYDSIGYAANILGDHGGPWYFHPAYVELLARSPADFADEVRLVTYEQWLTGDDGTIQQAAGDATVPQ